MGAQNGFAIEFVEYQNLNNEFSRLQICFIDIKTACIERSIQFVRGISVGGKIGILHIVLPEKIYIVKTRIEWISQVLYPGIRGHRQKYLIHIQPTVTGISLGTEKQGVACLVKERSQLVERGVDIVDILWCSETIIVPFTVINIIPTATSGSVGGEIEAFRVPVRSGTISRRSVAERGVIELRNIYWGRPITFYCAAVKQVTPGDFTRSIGADRIEYFTAIGIQCIVSLIIDGIILPYKIKYRVQPVIGHQSHRLLSGIIAGVTQCGENQIFAHLDGCILRLERVDRITQLLHL